MFEALSDRFDGIFKKLRGKGRLREEDVDEVLREIRVALLEADVNFKVVRGMLDRIRERAVGMDLSEALNPAQQVIKIVHEELIAVLGGDTIKITYASKPPTVVLMAGLQGAGKTTNAAKLARWFKQQGRNPLLVGADLQRPAAVEQLRTLGRQIDVPVFSEPGDPVATAKAGLDEARRLGRDVLIVDTAGRLAIDEELMEQVGQISEVTSPHYTFLVIDAMTGQDAVNTAESFNATLALDGVILTKLDGDARGGAALSLKAVTNKPIKFAGIGEKPEDFEPFHPERMASRILGMGDVVSLVEKAAETVDMEEAKRMEEKMRKGQFTLEDFLEQLRAMKKMGPLESIVSMLPGGSEMVKGADMSKQEKEFRRMEGMICAMTKQERKTPQILNARRRQRIAKGSGVTVTEVNTLLNKFGEMQQMMKKMGKFQKMMARMGGGPPPGMFRR